MASPTARFHECERNAKSLDSVNDIVIAVAIPASNAISKDRKRRASQTAIIFPIVAVTPLSVNRVNSRTSITEALTVMDAPCWVIFPVGYATVGRPAELLPLSRANLPHRWRNVWFM